MYLFFSHVTLSVLLGPVFSLCCDYEVHRYSHSSRALIICEMYIVLSKVFVL